MRTEQYELHEQHAADTDKVEPHGREGEGGRGEGKGVEGEGLLSCLLIRDCLAVY